MSTPPLIGISACVLSLRHDFHAAGDPYVRAVVAIGGLPVVLPSLGAELDGEAILARLDGLLLTGSPSNVEPMRYGGHAPRPDTQLDARRDATTLPLVRGALAAGLPLLAICRGHQELNVALGGTLFQNVHEVPGRREHRGQGASRDQRYAPAHSARLTPGGLLARLAGSHEIEINSLHAQAIDRVADGLEVEAVAPDGTVEAVRARQARSFALGVQWHPEWRLAENPVSAAIFAAFGDAARARAASRLAASAA